MYHQRDPSALASWMRLAGHPGNMLGPHSHAGACDKRPLHARRAMYRDRVLAGRKDATLGHQLTVPPSPIQMEDPDRPNKSCLLTITDTVHAQTPQGYSVLKKVSCGSAEEDSGIQVLGNPRIPTMNRPRMNAQTPQE